MPGTNNMPDCKCSAELAKLEALLRQERALWEQEKIELCRGFTARIANLTSELEEARRGGRGTHQQLSLLQQLAQRLHMQAEEKGEVVANLQGLEEKKSPQEGRVLEKLKACDLRELIEAKQGEYFQGSREWLFDVVREWLRQEEDNKNKHKDENNNFNEQKSKNKRRVFWLVGGAGTGKSVVSAQLLRTAGVQEHVKAWHFCRHDNAAGSDVRVILESWAAMLSALLPSFHVEDPAKALASTSAAEMFDLLIAEPFSKLQLQQQQQHQQNNVDGAPSSSSPMPVCLLVLDAVDELPRDCLEAVLQLIADKFDKLPSFVKLFVASRDESAVSTSLSQFEHIKLLVEEVRNQADLRMYLAHMARRHVTLELSIEDVETQLEREFKLSPCRLRGELRGLDQLLRRSKDTYVAAISKFEVTDSSHYRELCGISDVTQVSHSKQGGVKQCSGDLDELYKDASEAHHKLRSLFASEWREWKTVGRGKNKTVLSVPVEGSTALWVDKIVDPGLKARESALRKINIDYDGDASRVKDLVRFTASFASCGRMKQFVERLLHSQQAGLEVLGLKNKFSSPTPLGYRDVNVTLRVQLAEAGRFHVCELQVNLDDMLVAKDLAHTFYEEVRVEIPALCKRAGVADTAKFESSLTKLLRSSVLETAVRELQDKAEGLFLYASLLARQLEESSSSVGGGKIDFKQLRGLPAGLSEVYQTNFERMVQSREDWQLRYSRLIALIVAAREPLPVTLAREVMGAGWSEALERDLSVLFPVREGRFQVMHKSIADWLQDSERKSAFEINKENVKDAHESLGKSLRHSCLVRSPASLSSGATDVTMAFCVRHVVYHLCEAELWEELFELVTDVKWLLARAKLDYLGVVLDLEHAAARCHFLHPTTPKGFSIWGFFWKTLSACEGEADVTHRATIKLMGQALRMDLGELQVDYRSVPTRLVARLLGHSKANKEVETLLAKLREWEGPPQGWWCPSQPTYLPAGGALQTTFHFPSLIDDVQWSPGNRPLLAIACDSYVYIWEVSSGECIQTLKGHSSKVTAVSWSSDGTRICSSGSWDHKVRVWEVSNGKCIQTLQGHSSDVTAVSWNSDGTRICSASCDKTVRVWEVSSGKCIQTLKGHSSDVTAVSWNSDGTRTCSGSSDKTVRVWEVSSGECLQTLKGHSSYVTAVSWSNDGTRICSGSYDGTVRVWEVSRVKCIQPLEGHSSYVTAVSWSSDGTRICSGSYDGTVRVWTLPTRECIQTLKGHSSNVSSVSWSSDGTRICSGSWDKTVRVWEVSSGKCIETLEGHSSDVVSMSWSRDGTRFCSGSKDNTARVWELSSGKCIQILKGHFSDVNAVSWSNDGSRICSSGSFDNTVRVWEVSSGKCIQTLQGHSSYVTAVSWNNDGTRTCSGSKDNTVRVWEVSNGKCIQTLEGHSSAVTAVSWSSDGTRICSGSYDKTVRVWEVSSAKCIETLEGHSSSVTAVSWSSDGTRICSGSKDKTVRVWEVSSAKCIQTLKGHSEVTAVSWSNDGTRICSASADSTMRVWEQSSAVCLLVASSDMLFPQLSPTLGKARLPVGTDAQSRGQLSPCPTSPTSLAVEIEGSSVHFLRRLGGIQQHGEVKSWFDLVPDETCLADAVNTPWGI